MGITWGRAFRQRGVQTQVAEVDEYRGGGRGPGLFEAWVRRPVCLEQVRKVAGNEAGARSSGTYGHLRPLGFYS